MGKNADLVRKRLNRIIIAFLTRPDSYRTPLFRANYPANADIFIALWNFSTKWNVAKAVLREVSVDSTNIHFVRMAIAEMEELYLEGAVPRVPSRMDELDEAGSVWEVADGQKDNKTADKKNKMDNAACGCQNSTNSAVSGSNTSSDSATTSKSNKTDCPANGSNGNPVDNVIRLFNEEKLLIDELTEIQRNRLQMVTDKDDVARRQRELARKMRELQAEEAELDAKMGVASQRERNILKEIEGLGRRKIEILNQD